MTSCPVASPLLTPSSSDDSTGHTASSLTREQLLHKIRSWRDRYKRSEIKHVHLLDQVNTLRDHVMRLSASVDVLKYSELDGRSKLSELTRRVDQLTGERTPSSSHVPACTICLSNPCTHAAIPCGHVLYCDSCYGAASVVTSCPICRQRIKGFLRLFF